MTESKRKFFYGSLLAWLLTTTLVFLTGGTVAVFNVVELVGQHGLEWLSHFMLTTLVVVTASGYASLKIISCWPQIDKAKAGVQLGLLGVILMSILGMIQLGDFRLSLILIQLANLGWVVALHRVGYSKS